MNDKPTVSVAIVTWNRKEDVLIAISSALNQTYKPMEVVVVDSNSTDGTEQAIGKTFSSELVKYIKLHRNLGCPEGRNIAFANCKGNIIISLDDDGKLATDAIEKVVETFIKEGDNIGAIAFKVIEPGRKNGDEKKFIRSFTGGAFAIRSEIIKKIGYFRHDFFRQGEEGELSLRLIDAGYLIFYNPEVIMYHNRSTANRNLKTFVYYQCRNEMYTLFLRYPIAVIPLVLVKKVFSHIGNGLKNHAVFYVIKAWISALHKLPYLIKERKAISIKSYKKYLSFPR